MVGATAIAAPTGADADNNSAAPPADPETAPE